MVFFFGIRSVENYVLNVQTFCPQSEPWKQEAATWFDNIESQCNQQIKNAKMLVMFSADEKASKTIIGSFLAQLAFMFKGLDEQMKSSLPTMSAIMPIGLPFTRETPVPDPQEAFSNFAMPNLNPVFGQAKQPTQQPAFPFFPVSPPVSRLIAEAPQPIEDNQFYSMFRSLQE